VEKRDDSRNDSGNGVSFIKREAESTEAQKQQYFRSVRGNIEENIAYSFEGRGQIFVVGIAERAYGGKRAHKQHRHKEKPENMVQNRVLFQNVLQEILFVL
jgi:hypothetical protein